jgi:hypothetical protein
MKKPKKTLVVFLLTFSVIFTYLTPLVLAQGGNGNQNMYGQGNSSGNQQQGSPDLSNQTGGAGGIQNGGNNQNGSGQQGGTNGNYSEGGQYRHRFQRRYTIIDGAGNYTRIRSQCRNNVTQEAFEIFFTIDNASNCYIFPALMQAAVNASSASSSNNSLNTTISIPMGNMITTTLSLVPFLCQISHSQTLPIQIVRQ